MAGQRRGFLFAALLSALALPAGAEDFKAPEARAEVFGDADRGAGFWSQCKGCHEIGPDADIRIGPPLTGLFGRRAGAIDGFKYSKSMARMGADGLTWDWGTLDAYVENPKALVSGTRMAYRGIKDAQNRADPSCAASRTVRKTFPKPRRPRACARWTCLTRSWA